MNILKKILTHISLAVTVSIPMVAIAASDTTIPNPLVSGTSSLPDLIKLILNNVILPVASVLVVLYIIYAGFTYVTAQGNAKKVEDAHRRLLWSLIGAGVLLGAWGISSVIENTVNSLIN